MSTIVEKNKKLGPLTTVKLVNQKKNYIKCEQEKVASSDKIEDDKKKLNLEKNDDGVYICKVRLQGFHPVYLWQDSVLSKKVILCRAQKVITWGSSHDNVSC